ncbi:MAG: hypothetical protein IPH12_04635 [Saprospirales bacterium]|nr:hypothetical protein [Saprospirales bacterium]
MTTYSIARRCSAFLLFTGVWLFSGPFPRAWAQVAVNTDGSSADPSAMLDVKSTLRGVLIPRMSTAERTAITTPATGLLAFDSDTNTFWFYNGTAWEQLISASIAAGPNVITPPQLTASAHNYNPAGFGNATIVRISGDIGFQMISGFNAETNGEEKTIVNVGNYPVYLAPEHSGSTAANRISYFEEVVIPPGTSCRVLYDGVISRWRPLTPPCPNYMHSKRSVHYDKSAGKIPEGASDDIHIDVFGSLQQTATDPSATSPFTSWNFNTGSATAGGLGLFYPRSSEDMAQVGSAHIVAKMHFKSPAQLGDETNNYYFFLRIADLPSSGFWNQNNSLGLRYWHSVNSGNWQCYSRSNTGTDTALDTGIPFAVNTEYELLVTLNKSNTEATYYINGVVVGRITTNLPAAVSVGPSTHLEKLSGNSARSVLAYRFMGAAIAP